MDKYTWCRLEEARDCERKDPHAHISIQSPGASPIRLRCNSSGLWLYFIDLNPREIRRTKAASKDPKKAAEIAAGCMSMKQAHEIVTFVEDHPCPIVVNCEAGISRSPAVVMALRDWYEGSTLSVLKYAVPNMHAAFTMAYVLRLRDSWSKCYVCKSFIKYGETVYTIKDRQGYGATGPAKVLLTLCSGCRAELIS